MIKIKIVSVLTLLFLFTICSRQVRSSLFKVQEIHGEATLIRSGESKPLELGIALHEKDALIISDKSMVKIGLEDGSIMFVSSSSCVHIKNNTKKKNKIIELTGLKNIYVGSTMKDLR